MNPGLTMEQLEQLIRQGNSHIRDKQFRDFWHDACANMEAEELIEVCRIAIMTLAYRHAGFADSPLVGSSVEGLAHSYKRVIDLIKESIDN